MNNNLNMYTAVIKKCSDNSFYGFFPDFKDEECSASASSLSEIIKRLQISLTMHTKIYIEHERTLPEPKEYYDIQKLYPNCIIQLISIDESLIIMKNTRPVKKTLSIPAYLDELGRKYGLSFSSVLKDALLAKLRNQNNLSDQERRMLALET